MRGSAQRHQQQSVDRGSLRELENKLEDEVASFDSEDLDSRQNYRNRASSKGEPLSSFRDSNSSSKPNVEFLPPKQVEAGKRSFRAGTSSVQTSSVAEVGATPSYGQFSQRSNIQSNVEAKMSTEKMEIVKQKERLAYNRTDSNMSFQEMQAVKQREKLAYRRENSVPGAFSMQTRSRDNSIVSSSAAEASGKSSIQSESGRSMSFQEMQAVKRREKSAYKRENSVPGAFSMQTRSEDNSIAGASKKSSIQSKGGGSMSFQEMQAVKQREKLAYKRENSVPGAFSMQTRSEDNSVASSSVAEVSRKSSIQSESGGSMSFQEMQAVKRREKSAYKRENSVPGAFSMQTRSEDNSVAEASRKSSIRSESGGSMSFQEMQGVKQREKLAYKRENSAPGAFSMQRRSEDNSIVSSSVAEASRKSSIQSKSGGRTSLEEMEAAKQKERFTYSQKGSSSTATDVSSCTGTGEKSEIVSSLAHDLQPGAIRVEYSGAIEISDSSDEASGVRGNLQTLERDALAKRGKYTREGMSSSTRMSQLSRKSMSPDTDVGSLVVRRDLQTLEKNVMAKTSQYEKETNVLNRVPESTVESNPELKSNESQSNESQSREVDSRASEVSGDIVVEDNENNGDNNNRHNNGNLCFNLQKSRRNLFLLPLLLSVIVISIVIIIAFIFKGNNDDLTIDETPSAIPTAAPTITLSEKPSFAPITWDSDIYIENEGSSIGATLGFMDQFLVSSNGTIVQTYDTSNNATKIGRYLIGESVYVSDSKRVAVKVNDTVRVYEFSNNDWVQIGDEIEGFQPEQNISISGDGSTIAISALIDKGTRCVSRIFRFDGRWERLGDDIRPLQPILVVENSLSYDGNSVILGFEQQNLYNRFSLAYEAPLQGITWTYIRTKAERYRGGPQVHMSDDGKIILTAGYDYVQAFSTDGTEIGEKNVAKNVAVSVLSRDGNYAAFNSDEKVVVATIVNGKWHQHQIISEIRCSRISSLAFSGNDKLAIGCGPGNGLIQIFEVKN